MVVFSPVAGRISDRIESRVAASIGMAIDVIGLAIFVFLSQMTSLTFVASTLLIIGFGFALFSSPNMSAIMGSIRPRFYGIASATLGTMRVMGQVLSMGVATLLFALYMGKVQITPQYYPVFLESVKTASLSLPCSAWVAHLLCWPGAKSGNSAALIEERASCPQISGKRAVTGTRKWKYS